MVTPSLLTTTVPMTPLCPTNLFRVSSTSVAIVVLLSHWCHTGITLVFCQPVTSNKSPH